MSPSSRTARGGAFAGQVTIRGFQDGQYNVTLDGIPFGDPNNYTHHTSSYFMNRDLGSIVVDRGPGTASTIGNATFGGTVELNTKLPAVRTTLTPYAAYGSFNTALYGGQLDSGKLPGGGSLVLDVERTTTDGAISLGRSPARQLLLQGRAADQRSDDPDPGRPLQHH